MRSRNLLRRHSLLSATSSRSTRRHDVDSRCVSSATSDRQLSVTLRCRSWCRQKRADSDVSPLPDTFNTVNEPCPITHTETARRRRGVVVSGVRKWTKLTHVGPGYNWDWWPSSSGYTISGCSQPTRSTQPCIPLGSLNRVPASAGVTAGMSPLPGGR